MRTRAQRHADRDRRNAEIAAQHEQRMAAIRARHDERAARARARLDADLADAAAVNAADDERILRAPGPQLPYTTDWMQLPANLALIPARIRYIRAALRRLTRR